MKSIDGLKPQKACCATCPFKKNERGHWQDSGLANTVIQRTLLKSQQLCHGSKGGGPDEKIDQEHTRLCRGARDYYLEIYHRLGMIDEPTDEAWQRKADSLPKETV